MSSSSETLLRPRTRARPATGQTRGLSTEIIGQSARRLRILALVYAFVFFMSAFMGNLFFAEARAEMLANPGYWLPDLLSIAMALLVAALTLTKKVPLALVMNFGLVFLVTSNYGIAISEYINPERLDRFGWVGLSWVAVWTPLYSVAVPTPPRKALAAMLAAVSAVPVMVGYMILTERTVIRLGPLEFFFAFVFPYLLVVVLGYVGAHVVYDLGKEVTRAQDLGSYHLVERLGQGGMGEVWRAQHRLLARPAAIKLIRPALIESSGDAGGVLRRFEREAQVTAQLRSPHTVELFDFGVAADGAFYYVMELLDGMDLEALVNRHGPVPAERAIHLLRQVCHSLAEAESKGLVHRDIKPSNIFACVYGGDHDFVKVLDFGIVKATDTSNTETGVRATSTMLLQGTPAFIAPEQAMGSGAIDGRADIYATGCVAYWLLTGQLVFSADTAMGTIMHHARTAPTAPSQRSEMAIPPDFDALVLACLAKDPAERPQSAGELSRRLASVACSSDWSDERAREWWSAHHPVAAT